MVETRATPSSETDGETEKDIKTEMRERERAGGAERVRPDGTQGREMRRGGPSGLGPAIERRGCWTGTGLRAWAGGAAARGHDRGGGGASGGGGAMEHAEGGEQTDPVWGEANPGTERE